MSAALLDVIQADGGFTFDAQRGELLRIGDTTGYMIAVPGTETLLGPTTLTREEFASHFVDLIRQSATNSNTYVGGWLSPDRGYMIELSELHRVSRDQAIEVGMRRNQEAILDIGTGEFIETGSKGDAG